MVQLHLATTTAALELEYEQLHTAMSTAASIVPPSMAWMTVFFPALAYFVVSRLAGSGGSSWGRFTELGEVITNALDVFDSPTTTTASPTAICEKLSSIFYISSCSNTATLSRTLNLVQTTGLNGIQSSCWRHDPEAGRGHLLLSQSSGRGRVWRWEVGGGPIPIGKTLHLEASGCRSGQWKPCGDGQAPTAEIATESSTGSQSPIRAGIAQVGSGGIAMDFSKQEHFSAGRLVVAEWGEGRIARLEDNGARTPLVLQIPDVCVFSSSSHNQTTLSSSYKRLEAPSHLLYTPFGDLLFADVNRQCQKAALFRLRQAVHVPHLASLTESRQAHLWTNVSHHQQLAVDVVFSQDDLKVIGGVSLDSKWTGVYLSAAQKPQHGGHDAGFNHVILYHLALPGEDDDDDDDVHESDASTEAVGNREDAKNKQANKKKAPNLKMVVNLTQALSSSSSIEEADYAGPVAMDNMGNIFVGISTGIAIVQPAESSGVILATLSFGGAKSIRTLTVGEDGFLYFATETQLFRIAIKTKPLKIPTNLVSKTTGSTSRG